MERNEVREGQVAVAIDKEKSSHNALKWAIEHYIPQGRTVKLVHVIQRSVANSNGAPIEDELPERQHNDKRSTPMFLPLRCLCMRRNIQSELEFLEEQDVAKALVEYVSQNCISTIVLGASMKKSITRLFRGQDIPSNVMRWAPEFSNVLVISKGRLASARSATRPLPQGLPLASGATTSFSQNTNTNDETASVMSLSLEDDMSFEEFSAVEPDVAFTSAGGMDNSFLSFYEKLGSTDMWESVRLQSTDANLRQKPELSADLSCSDSLSVSAYSPGRFAPDYMDDIEGELRRVKIELKQMTDMYHAACNETIIAKQKVGELETWKQKAEQRLQIAEETTLAMVEMERSKCKAATEKAEAVRRLVNIKVQRRADAEMKAEERKLVLDALGRSHIIVKYESLIHILVVLFLFYFYFSMFK